MLLFWKITGQLFPTEPFMPTTDSRGAKGVSRASYFIGHQAAAFGSWEWECFCFLVWFRRKERMVMVRKRSYFGVKHCQAGSWRCRHYMQLHHLRTGKLINTCNLGASCSQRRIIRSPGTLFEARKVAGSATYKNKVMCCPLRSVWLFTYIKTVDEDLSPQKTTRCTFNFSGLFFFLTLTRLMWMNMHSQSETWQIDTGTQSPVSLGNLQQQDRNWGVWSACRVTRLWHVNPCERWSSCRFATCSRPLTSFLSHDLGHLRHAMCNTAVVCFH